MLTICPECELIRSEKLADQLHREGDIYWMLPLITYWMTMTNPTLIGLRWVYCSQHQFSPRRLT